MTVSNVAGWRSSSCLEMTAHPFHHLPVHLPRQEQSKGETYCRKRAVASFGKASSGKRKLGDEDLAAKQLSRNTCTSSTHHFPTELQLRLPLSSTEKPFTLVGL
jgi:hypothetical protein